MPEYAGVVKAKGVVGGPQPSLAARFRTSVRKYWFIYLLAIPGLVFLLVFSYAPMYGVVLAFKDFKMNKGIMGSPWVGLAHYRELFSDPAFIQAFKNHIFLCSVSNDIRHCQVVIRVVTPDGRESTDFNVSYSQIESKLQLIIQRNGTIGPLV